MRPVDVIVDAEGGRGDIDLTSAMTANGETSVQRRVQQLMKTYLILTFRPELKACGYEHEKEMEQESSRLCGKSSDHVS